MPDLLIQSQSTLKSKVFLTANQQFYYTTGKVYFKYKGDAEERHKNRLDVDGKVPEDWWTDISKVQGNAAERIGYPTQKPESLMERIIKCASNEGDVVLDPFMGGGTTIAVADKLNRRWIGIDQSVTAVKVTEQRLHRQNGRFEVIMTQQNFEKASA